MRRNVSFCEEPGYEATMTLREAVISKRSATATRKYNHVVDIDLINHTYISLASIADTRSYVLRLFNHLH